MRRSTRRPGAPAWGSRSSRNKSGACFAAVSAGMRPPEPGRIALSCAREKPHRNVGEKNQDARLEGKTVGSERALIERRLLMRLVQDEEEHARADQREVEEHEERVGDALARVVAALRRGRGFGLREAQEPEKLCWIAAEIVQPGEERALGA